MLIPQRNTSHLSVWAWFSIWSGMNLEGFNQFPLLTCVWLLLEHWWQRHGRLRPEPNQTSCVSFPHGTDCARHVFHTTSRQRGLDQTPRLGSYGHTWTRTCRHIGVLAIQTFFRDRAATQAEIISLVSLNLSGEFSQPSSSRLLNPVVKGRGWVANIMNLNAPPE